MKIFKIIDEKYLVFRTKFNVNFNLESCILNFVINAQNVKCNEHGFTLKITNYKLQVV
jgi:hypothetical protein